MISTFGGVLAYANEVRFRLSLRSWQWHTNAVMRWLCSVLCCVLLGCAGAQNVSARPFAEQPLSGTFRVLPLGTSGGLDEANLSSYLLSVRGDDRWVALDAGTLYAGLRAAEEHGVFSSRTPPVLLREQVRVVFVSHPHFDHVAGLVLNSPDDGPRSIYGTAATLDALRDHVFNGVVWANFLDEGTRPLRRYHLVRLAPGTEQEVEGTAFRVQAHLLAHAGDGASTAFLLRAGNDSVLYLGDTGPDAVEHSERLAALWNQIAPLVRTRALRGIFLECSYPEERSDQLLFGHLTPRWIRTELDALARAVAANSNGADTLAGLTVVVTHIKPASYNGIDARTVIERQLGTAYRGARFVYPQQGVVFGL